MLSQKPADLSLLLALAIVLVLGACDGETVETPKPRAFPRIDFPTAAATASFGVEVCPFDFEHPDYVRVERDTAYFDEAPSHPCWFDLVTPALDGRVHLSYYPIGSEADFEEYRDDAYELVGKHNVVATGIEETPIVRPSARVYGFSFDVSGDVASPYQLFVTDSTRHFLRAAVYVNARARADSLAPVYDFLKRDLETVVATLAWEGSTE